jgi:ribosomal protein L3 glutamine methyltransferase
MVREKSAHSIAALKNVRDAIVWAEKSLANARLYFGHGTDNALDEAAWLVAAAIAVSPSKLAKLHRRTITPIARVRLEEFVAQRIATRKPAAYLLHEAWFAGLPFYVDERVIVPRSLTGEFIQKRFTPWIDTKRVRRILDLCTGSGCMAIACARAFPSAQVDAVDISNDALAVAGINVDRHKLVDRVHLLQSDLFSNLAGRHYDVIVTNPPYVGRAEMKTLPEEYRHEPRLALESGSSGLDATTRILRDAARFLEPQGVLIAEVGNSKEALQRRFPDLKFRWLRTTSGDDSVFLLTSRQLTDRRPRGQRHKSKAILPRPHAR